MSTAWLIEQRIEWCAGESAPPGYYRRIDRDGGAVIRHRGGPLPASCDGRRATYVRVRPWEITSANLPAGGSDRIGATG